MDLFAEDSVNQEPTADTVTGKISAIFFSSPDSFYKVLLVKVSETSLDWHEDELVVTGNFADVKEEVTYTFTGKKVDHPKYGTQFQAQNYQAAVPTSRSGLISYLSGDEFPGVGKKTAERIVDLLGLDAIDEILSNPQVLAPLNLKAPTQKMIVETLQANNGMEQIIIGLNGYGFGSQLAAAIYDKYQGKTLDVIHENPYQLAEDIDHISFKRADQIAKDLGFQDTAPERIRAGLLQTLTDLSMANGDIYTSAKPLMNQTLGLLESARPTQIAPDAVATQLIELAKEQKVVGDQDRIYLKKLYDAEWGIAEHLNRLLKDIPEQTQRYSPDAIDKQIRIVEKQLGITYDDSQKQALSAAISSQVFLLTGGPGTGKTTIIRGLVALFAKLHGVSLDVNEYKDQPFPVLLAAPTGRAAKRMSETTNLPASTIHRLLGLTGREKNEAEATTNDLEGGLLIIDEMSMVDVFLFRSLLKAIPSGMQVILVGDKDQLPSVGPGQVFSDLLASKSVPAIELSTIYRQGDGSSIIPLAHAIKEGQLPADFSMNQRDRSFISCNLNQIEPVIRQIIERAKAKGFTAQQIQVLAPIYRGAAGINRLNAVIQEIMNPLTSPRQKDVLFHDQHFRIGDKVLHLVNSPENNVFNGDIGQVVGIELAKDKGNKDKTDKLTIAFEQTEVTYSRNDWNRLTLAYCMSIHKSQGSEFTMVILPMVMQYSRMLQRNLLYTAITRASQMLIMLGDQQAFQASVDNVSINRKTTLRQRLAQVIQGQAPTETNGALAANEQEITQDEPIQATEPDPEITAEGPKILTADLILSQRIDPMIGMSNIKPSDFMTPAGRD
ncbi:SF1B family DNA helicase RecD2 [Levilactobacillus bambusae]|uniref:ATP-dependent RecD2 DNA helicase n=1 Tax=Levilactobacillus bambusae TaxID=2024736 RepID=A0A2V1N1M4_9LACO|nr:ATP-dependent RecD-like DNA helicase [Levilactobacillus bambusae]PWG01104.1 ATP-dependent RecD-like DNA helicase [Levilactobacillus bambusae]